MLYIACFFQLTLQNLLKNCLKNCLKNDFKDLLITEIVVEYFSVPANVC